MHGRPQQDKKHVAIDDNEPFLATFEQVPVGLALMTWSGLWLRVNHRFAELLNYTPEELLQRTDQQITHAQDLPAHLDHMRQLRNGATHTFSMDKRLVRKNGTCLWVRITVSPLLMPPKGAERLVVVIEDIHERKLIEQQQATEHAVARILAEAPLSATAIPQILEAICRGYKWDWGTIWTIVPGQQTLHAEGIWHEPALDARKLEDATRQMTFAIGNGLPGQAWAENRVIIVEDIAREAGFIRHRLAHQTGLHGAACFPLHHGHEILGVMEFFCQSTVQPEKHLIDTIAVAGELVGQYFYRKRTMETIRQSEERFRSLVAATAQIVWTTCPHGWFTDESVPWCGFTGQTREQARGQGWLQALHPDDRQQAMDEWNAAVASKRLYKAEYRLRRYDGVYRHMIARGVPIIGPEGEIREWVGTCTDVTDRKQAEAFRDSQNRILELVATGKELPEVLASLIQTVEQQCQGVRGSVLMLDEDRLHLRHFIAPNLPPAYQQAVDGFMIGPNAGSCGTAAYTGKPVIVRNIQTDPRWDGGRELARTFNLVACWSQPIFSPQQQVLGTFALYPSEPRGPDPMEQQLIESAAHLAGIAIERHRAETALRNAKEAAETANRAKDHFLAVLSHELRTPLTPVLVEVAMMEEANKLSPTAREEIALIRRNVEMEARLIDDLLDLTRISRGKIDLHPEIMDVHQALQQTLSICRSDIHAKNLHITLNPDAQTHIVRADPARMQQVFWNLLKNAIKFTQDGGRITLQTRNGPPLNHNHAPSLIVEVTDTGIGIDPQIIPRLFQAFEQGERSITGRLGGLGLGLAISRAIIDLHGGKLTASSPGKNKGATFSVELSTVARKEHPTPEPIAPAQPAQKTSRVLLVEDHDDTRRVMTRLLRSFGHTVLAAASVREAVGILDREPVDVLVSDLSLPDGSGHDIMNYIKGRLPIQGLALSGLGMEEDLAHSSQSGFRRHLIKPIKPRELDDAIRQLVGS